MKKLIIGFCILGSSVVFGAESASDMTSKWVCTTNASSSDVASDKAADDQMTKREGSAAQSFTYAAQNCRDCTKITCELK